MYGDVVFLVSHITCADLRCAALAAANFATRVAKPRAEMIGSLCTN